MLSGRLASGCISLKCETVFGREKCYLKTSIFPFLRFNLLNMQKGILGLIVILLLGSCGSSDPNQNVDEGTIENRTYSSEEVGWRIEIPNGWEITEKAKTEAINEQGAEALEEYIEDGIDVSEMKNLIGFQKDQFNSFLSTTEPFELEYEGEWEENNQALKLLIYSVYEQQGLIVDSSITTTETIDGLDFRTYDFTLYTPDGEVLMKQIMYSRLINGLDFGVNINYNNRGDRVEMLEAFRNSSFLKQTDASLQP